MGWPEVVLGALNVFQAIALALIAVKARQLETTLSAHNGDHARDIRTLRAALLSAPPPGPPGGH